LCVQPSLENQAFVHGALGRYNVVMAASAFDAIRLMNRSVFNAYILDYWLPDWGGPALCREIRKSDPNVPIIFYTVADAAHSNRALRAGAQAYIEAPVDAGVLRERVQLLIEAADIHDLRARIEEEQTIQEELERQAAAAIQRAQQAMQQADIAIERIAKIKASKAFIHAGGTCAGFQRFWPHQFAAVQAREGST
jgi:DNA-binding NtrC family response regulator